MKKCILSTIAGALTMLIVIIIAANIHTSKKQAPTEYKHIDYISNVSSDECYVCGNLSSFAGAFHWGEDNVGIVNLNTFEFLYLEINRYDDQGNLIEEPVGVMSSSGMSDKKNETYVHAFCHPDNGYADVQLTGVQYNIDRDSVQNLLCQTCLDSINDLWFTGQPPAEFAVISLDERTIQPLLNAHPWFSTGNFGIDCEFKDDGKIDLLIHYCAPRYEKSSSQNDEPGIE